MLNFFHSITDFIRLAAIESYSPVQHFTTAHLAGVCVNSVYLVIIIYLTVFLSIYCVHLLLLMLFFFLKFLCYCDSYISPPWDQLRSYRILSYFILSYLNSGRDGSLWIFITI